MALDAASEYVGKTDDFRFGVRIPLSVLRRVIGWCENSEGYETGGVLIGRYSKSQRFAVITEALPAPADSKAGPTWFVRGTRALNDMLEWRWRSGGGYYLGEWHFHPGGAAVPSNVDSTQMRSISESAHYACPEPVLVILGGTSSVLEFRSYVFPRGQEFIEFTANAARI